MRDRLLAVAALVLGTSILCPVASYAVAYDAEYVFGDSLSDRGNLAETGALQIRAGIAPPVTNFPNPPSYHDSFTNGPTAVQDLASSLGLNADPSLWLTGFRDVNGLFGGSSYAPGTNYAVAGATASASAQGGTPLINLPQQTAAYLLKSGAKADPNALYVVMIGGNDVRDAALYGNGATGASAITTGVQAEVASIGSLLLAGARNILVANVPNVGLIPEFTQDNPGLAAEATAYSQSYNSLLATSLGELALQGADLTQFDLYAYNEQIAANAAALGFTDTTDRCFTNTPLSAATTPQCGPLGENIDGFIYWDSIHPTARVQQLWAEGMLAALEGVSGPSPVPEPASLALVGVGLLWLAGAAYRRQQARILARCPAARRGPGLTRT